MVFSSIHLPANFRMSFFFCCVVIHCVNVPHFPYTFIGRGAFRLFPGLAMTNNADINIVEHMSLWHDWASFEYITISGILGSWGRLVPDFLRNHHTDIQRGCTSLNSHQQYGTVHFIPQSLQHKLSSVFLILVILTGVRWNLRVVLICISLMTKDVEHFLKCLSAILDSSVESSLFRSVLHFFYWIICSFDDQFLEFFVYFGDQTSVWCRVSEDLFSFCRLPFCPVDRVLCFTGAFQFQEVPFINCCSQCLCYWGYI